MLQMDGISGNESSRQVSEFDVTKDKGSRLFYVYFNIYFRHRGVDTVLGQVPIHSWVKRVHICDKQLAQGRW